VKKPLLKPEPPPAFKPLPIYNENEYSEPKLPDYVNNEDPWQLFKLFWLEELINRLVVYINENTKLHLPLEDKDFPYKWKPISRRELYAYLAVLIYIGLHTESSIKDY
jgi:hypothetical protein